MTKAPRSANDNRAYVPAPLLLPAYPGAARVHGRTLMPGGGVRQRWISRTGMIYEWDYRHGAVEVYATQGRHLGELDPVTVVKMKPPNPSYKVGP
jgi:hypothetical protein